MKIRTLLLISKTRFSLSLSLKPWKATSKQTNKNKICPPVYLSELVTSLAIQNSCHTLPQCNVQKWHIARVCSFHPESKEIVSTSVEVLQSWSQYVPKNDIAPRSDALCSLVASLLLVVRPGAPSRVLAPRRPPSLAPGLKIRQT